MQLIIMRRTTITQKTILSIKNTASGMVRVQTHSLGQGESKNGIREKLLLEGRISGITNDQRAEHGSNSSSRSGNTDGGSSGTDELSGRVNVCSGSRGRQRSLARDGRSHASGSGQGHAGADGQASDSRHSDIKYGFSFQDEEMLSTRTAAKQCPM